MIHLADCELAFGFRYRQTFALDNHTVQPFDQDLWAKTYEAYGAEQALAAFTTLRDWNLTLIRSLTPEQFAKTCQHPERGQETLRTLIEINAHPARLDIDWVHCKRAKQLEVKLVINPDAHSTGEIGLYRYGVDVARRGWLQKKDVFNTLTLAQVTKALAARKKAAT